MTEDHLSGYTYEDLCKALVISHAMVEEKKQPMMVVEVRRICMN